MTTTTLDTISLHPERENVRTDYGFEPISASTADRVDSDLAEDLAIAVEVRMRIAQDTGERTALADFIRQEGFNPADFDVE